MSNTCLQLKGSVVTSFILELYRYSVDEFTQQLNHKIDQAPAFFDQSPLVISLDKLDQELTDADLIELISICKECNLQPMAFRSENARFTRAIQQTGLVHLSNASSRASAVDLETPIAVEQPVADVASLPVKSPILHTAHKPEASQNRIISRPVRSGQQVYAEGGDLIILSQVSEGAEVLADGNIHIYGTLRGRALAGVKGNTSARVFCTHLEAELISIAGNFMLSDALRAKRWQAPAQIYLDSQTLHVDAL